MSAPHRDRLTAVGRGSRELLYEKSLLVERSNLYLISKVTRLIHQEYAYVGLYVLCYMY